MDFEDLSEGMLESLVRAELLDPAVLRIAAAVGITGMVWRNTVLEDAHVEGRLHDGEMFAANAATTRLVRSFLESGDTDWAALSEHFVDPGRRAGRRTVVDLMGPHYQGWAARAEAAILLRGEWAADRGDRWVLLISALFAPSGWWGLPAWPSRVDRFLAGLEAPHPEMTVGDLRSMLLEAPDAADPELLRWCVHSGITYV